MLTFTVAAKTFTSLSCIHIHGREYLCGQNTTQKMHERQEKHDSVTCNGATENPL